MNTLKKEGGTEGCVSFGKSVMGSPQLTLIRSYKQVSRNPIGDKITLLALIGTLIIFQIPFFHIAQTNGTSLLDLGIRNIKSLKLFKKTLLEFI